MFLCEDYNSPQSPYWCLKTLVAIALVDNDEFWATQEAAYPSIIDPPCALVPTPKQIVCNHPQGNHHFLLSPAQFVAWPMKATQAKYSKFAYSSAFAFSVPTGPLIQQIAPDSTLALSRDAAETWAVKWRFCEEATFSEAHVHSHGTAVTNTVPIAKVRWYPWSDRSVSVETTLVPPTDRWPDWHIRIHRICMAKGLIFGAPAAAKPILCTVEGGFAISDRRKEDSKPVPVLDDIPHDAELGLAEGVITDGNSRSCLVFSSAGASGIAILGSSPAGNDAISPTCTPLKPDSNTNLVSQRTVIPVAKAGIPWTTAEEDRIVLVTGVFAVSSEANGGRSLEGKSLRERWLDVPRVAPPGEAVIGTEEKIVVDS